MQIAIVAPSAVPFCVGGAENLWWGLLEHINQETEHQAELIKLPSPETSFWELIESYRNLSHLDLSHFDVVLSSKYPAWMVQHSSHVCYLQHRLRGLYDTYHFLGQPEDYEASNRKVAGLQKFMANNQGNRRYLELFFAQLDQLRSELGDQDSAFQFPGPFAREVVHFMDNIALSPGLIRKYAAISRNVAGRRHYFPPSAQVEVIYHPSNLKSFSTGESEYLFTVSRLDSAKRIALLIEAMKLVQSPIELRIAGTGPDEESLKQLAGNDKRIVWLGFISDQAVVEAYANSLAVLYVPYDEDYGLVTIEAMMSAKPVITTRDSGGPNEFVVSGETGYVVEPEPQALAERIDYLCEHRDEAREMGKTAQRQVQFITWESTVAKLLKLPEARKSQVPVSDLNANPTALPAPHNSNQVSRKRMVVVTTYPIYPPRGGGQSRVFNLYKNLTHLFEIEVVSFTSVDQPAFSSEIAPGLYETRIPKSQAHQEQESNIEREIGVPVTDVVMPQLYKLTPDYVDALKTAVDRADLLVACHPYLYPALRTLAPHKPLWYEAQDVEISLKQGILPAGEASDRLLASIRRVEQQCCDDSELIFTCAQRDSQELQEIYGIAPEKIIEAANGVDLEAILYIPLAQRRQTQQRLKVSPTHPIAIFLGSWHGPNLEAVEHILALAIELPHVQFLIMGSVGMKFQAQPCPANVGFLGVVDDVTKAVVLEIADIALNPITYGSGTNLKMLEYFAAGIPVISTPFGVRGLEVETETHCLIAQLEDFAGEINRLAKEPDEQLKKQVEAAHQHVEATFAWPVIAERFLAHAACLDLSGL